MKGRIVVEAVGDQVFGNATSGRMVVSGSGLTGGSNIGRMIDGVFTPYLDVAATVGTSFELVIECGLGTVLAVNTSGSTGTLYATGA